MSNPEREVTDIAEILAILSKHEVCRIGFNDNLCPYVVPVNFGYEYQNGRWIFYFHGARTGKRCVCYVRTRQYALKWTATMHYYVPMTPVIIATPTPAFSPPDWHRYCKRARRCATARTSLCARPIRENLQLSGRYDESGLRGAYRMRRPHLPPTSGDSERISQIPQAPYPARRRFTGLISAAPLI